MKLKKKQNSEKKKVKRKVFVPHIFLIDCQSNLAKNSSKLMARAKTKPTTEPMNNEGAKIPPIPPAPKVTVVATALTKTTAKRKLKP